MKTQLITLAWIFFLCLLKPSLTIDCSNVENSYKINVDDSSCLCITGYFWNGTACSNTPNIFQCYSIPNANFTAVYEGANCVCNTGYNWINGVCQVDCTRFPNSIGTANGTQSCNCKPGYLWDGVDCVGDSNTNICASVANATGARDSTGACICVSGFIWNSNACWLDCGRIPFTTGSFGSSPMMCNCVAGYTWTGTTCQAGAINCQSIPGALGPSPTGVGCSCLSTLVWNGTNCTTSQSLNCSAIPYAFAPNPSNPMSCICTTGYIWRQELTACQRNCSLILNSTGINNGSNACICSSGFTWNVSSNLCVRNSLNCSMIPYATRASVNDPSIC